MNYQLEFEHMLDEVSKLDRKPTLLLHDCCAPCSSHVLELLHKYFEITILYYNPNIYPESEYYRRKNELERFLTEFAVAHGIKLIECDYNTHDYDEAVKGLETLGERSKRCYACYYFRLEKTAQYAMNNDYQYFTTTLSISPYKISPWINEIGEFLQDKYQVKYLYADFKKKNGYKRSLELSKEYNLYRQEYCGCKYSKEERKEH